MRQVGLQSSQASPSVGFHANAILDIVFTLTPLLLPSVVVCPEKSAQPWKAPLPETEKRTITLLEAATAAESLRSVGGGKLQTPEAWLIAASNAARLPALGFTT